MVLVTTPRKVPAWTYSLCSRRALPSHFLLGDRAVASPRGATGPPRGRGAPAPPPPPPTFSVFGALLTDVHASSVAVGSAAGDAGASTGAAAVDADAVAIT